MLSGGNGAGKTTLLKILAKLMRPDSGIITLEGRDLWNESDHIRKPMGFLSHQLYLYDDLNALENLRFVARLFDIDSPGERITKVLTDLDLFHRQYDPIRNYSRGMQQRLGLARAILHDPEILLLDEPFSGLDESGIDIFLHLLNSYKTQGKSVIIVSHNLQIGYEVADNLCILSHGNIEFQVEKQDISFSEFQGTYRQMLRSQS